MFKNEGRTGRTAAEGQRGHPPRDFETALALFREQGFERTTMRDVAARVGVSLGAAYYYFASKDAIVGAYYDHVHDGMRLGAARRSPRAPTLRRACGRPSTARWTSCAATASCCGRSSATAAIPTTSCRGSVRPRAPAPQSIAPLRRGAGRRSLPADLRDAGPTPAVGLHMGVLLFFVYDESPDQRRTRRLIDASVDWRSITTGRHIPLLRPMRRRLLGILGDAGLLPARRVGESLTR